MRHDWLRLCVLVCMLLAGVLLSREVLAVRYITPDMPVMLVLLAQLGTANEVAIIDEWCHERIDYETMVEALQVQQEVRSN